MRTKDLSKTCRWRKCEAQVELVIAPGSELGKVRLDPVQVEQVVMNLAANARDAMLEGGKLTIETQNVEIDGDYAQHRTMVPAGDYVLLEVTDTGQGIPAEHLPHIFEPFYTTKEQGKGTGLGLATVYGIVKQSGGFIWVYSEPGMGTTFKVYFPRVHQGARKTCGTGTAVAEVDLHGSETLLFVEDESAVRHPAVEFLKKCGYTVVEARDGLQATEAASKHSGRIDLMVTDVVMPGMSGGQLAEILRCQIPGHESVVYLRIRGEDRSQPQDRGRSHQFPCKNPSRCSPSGARFGRFSHTERQPAPAPADSVWLIGSFCAPYNQVLAEPCMNQSVALRDPQPGDSAFRDSIPDTSFGRSKSVWVLTLLWLVIYAGSMFTPALLDDVDSVHAEAGREMLVRHDWVTLYTNGVRYLEKAPLLYWGIATSYSMFGISDWSTRLPLMLGVLALILATYGLGRHALGEIAGLYAGVVLATSVGPFIFTRFLIPDVLVGLWLTVGYYFFLRSLEETVPSRLTCWGFAATCALNVLTKGLIGLVFPAGAIGIYLLLTGNLRHVLKLRLLSSTLVFFAIAAPWHVLAAMRNPSQGTVRGFLWFYFVNEHLMRFLNKRVPPGYDTVPLFIFWGLLLAWLLPWSIFLPQALRDVPLRWRTLRGNLDRRQRAALLFFLWALVIVGFFSLSTRQEYYTIPALPGMALLVGGWLARESGSAVSDPERRTGRISSAVLFVFGVLAFVAGMYLLSVSHLPASGADLADLLKKNPQDYDFSLGHVLDLTPQALGAFRGPLLGASLALFLGTGLNWILRRQGRAAQGNCALAIMMVGLLACVHVSFSTFSPILSSYKLAVEIRQHFQPGDTIVVDGEYHQASTLNFYTGVPLRVLHEASGNLWYGSKFPDAPHVFETPESFAALWKSSGHVFLWADQDNPKELQGMTSVLLARSGGKSIFMNRRTSD